MPPGEQGNIILKGFKDVGAEFINRCKLQKLTNGGTSSSRNPRQYYAGHG